MTIFNPRLLEEFRQARPFLEHQLSLLEKDLRRELSAAGIRLFSFSARLKSEESLQLKISRPDKAYESLWDITDLVGFRVVTAFEDSVEEIGRLLEARLAVDFANSRNRMQFEDHERFGYRSLHYVCHFPRFPGEEAPPERARFELQVRTALQDVWAEIEHDLGYKASDIAPSSLRRRFSRVASLLEIADEELVNIKHELRNYLNGGQDRPLLDLVSLEELAVHPEVAALDREVALALGLDISSRVFYPDYLLRALKLAEIRSPQEVLEKIREKRARVLDFIPRYFEFARNAWGLEAADMKAVSRGYSLLLLAHVVLLESDALAVNQVRQLAGFYAKLDHIRDPSRAWDVAGKLVEALDGKPGTNKPPT